MLDILCVRVNDSNTLVLVFFVHCGLITQRSERCRSVGLLISCYELDSCDASEVVTQTFPHPHTLVSATCCQQIPRRCPSHTLDLIFMSLQHSDTLKDKVRLWVKYTEGTTYSKWRLCISAHLKIIFLLFPDACGCIKAGRGQIIPTGRPGHFPHCALVSILKHSLAHPRVT